MCNLLRILNTCSKRIFLLIAGLKDDAARPRKNILTDLKIKFIIRFPDIYRKERTRSLEIRAIVV